MDVLGYNELAHSPEHKLWKVENNVIFRSLLLEHACTTKILIVDGPSCGTTKTLCEGHAALDPCTIWAVQRDAEHLHEMCSAKPRPSHLRKGRVEEFLLHEGGWDGVYLDLRGSVLGSLQLALEALFSHAELKEPLAPAGHLVL